MKIEIPQEYVVVVTENVGIRRSVLHGRVRDDRRVHRGNSLFLHFNVDDALDCADEQHYYSWHSELQHLFGISFNMEVAKRRVLFDNGAANIKEVAIGAKRCSRVLLHIMVCLAFACIFYTVQSVLLF